MKKELKSIFWALLLGAVIPWGIFGAAWELTYEPGPVPELTEPTQHPTQPERQEAVIAVLGQDGNIADMDLSDYLTGVLLKELPGDFEMNAKMAQAVVARTYALRTAAKGVKHPPGAVCVSASCCQGYVSVEEYLARGGSLQTVLEARMAVKQTEGIVLTYGSELIDATYFSCSGGKTEPALAVWGSDIPYLQSVESPGEEHAAHYTDTVSYTSQAFQDALGVQLAGTAHSWFGPVTYTQGGGVQSMYIGGEEYSGTALRSLLGLRSTAFTVTATADSVVITTRGFGHRVGMSQYGADAMAAGGSTWQEILLHYYSGAVIDKTEDLG